MVTTQPDPGVAVSAVSHEKKKPYLSFIHYSMFFTFPGLLGSHDIALLMESLPQVQLSATGA